MTLPAGVTAISCLYPLVVFLCVSQRCYGTRVYRSPRTNSSPSLYSNSGLKSLPEPTPLPSSIPEKHISPVNPYHRANSNLPPISPTTSNSNERLKLEHAPKQSSNSRQGIAYKSNSRYILNNPKQFSNMNPKTNPPTKPKALSNYKAVAGPNTNSETLPNTKSSLLPSPKQTSDSPDTIYPSTYYNASPPTLSNPESHSNFRTSQIHTNAKSNSKISHPNVRASIRVQRNKTKFLETAMDLPYRPKRGWIWNQFFVLEEHIGPEPQYVGKLHSNSDEGDGSVRYILSGEGAGSIFLIDETTGDIHAAKSLDRERKSQYVLHARAIDWRTNRSLEAESEFIIKVQDVNDNAPTFPDGPFSAPVPEMSDVGTSVLQVTASDADDPTYGNSAKIVYSILEGQPYFSVDPKTGIIRTAMSNMDRETRDHYAVVIQAKDMAGSVGGLSGSTTVNITLTDVNDNPPKFPQKSYQLYVPELAPVGKAVGRIRANDEDEGQNAEMSYSITNEDDAAVIFTITTDADRREGIISLKQPLNYEKRKVHTLNIEGSNTHPDSHFSHLGPFKDSTSLRVIVGDVDEPPVFSMDYYIMDMYENSPAGTQVGTVTAVDPDSTNSAVRYFIENKEERSLYFIIGVNSGIIRTTQVLDREETAWHNITVMAAEVENPRMVSHVPVTIQVLDVNDNIPAISGSNSAVIVCENTTNGQVIQTIRAADLDKFANGRFSFYVPAGLPSSPNFTVKDNGDNTASIISHQREGFRPDRDQEFFSLVLVVADGGEPPLSSTATLSLRVCVCQRNSRGRNRNICQAQAFLSSAGLSTGAFVAILLCIVILLAIVMLFTQLRNKKASKEPLILSEEDIRENVVIYDDEGGGEEDTEAFDIAALRNSQASEPRRKFHTHLGYGPSPYEEEDENEDDKVEDDEDGIMVVRRRKAQEVAYVNYSPEFESPWFVIGCVPREIAQSAPSLLLDGQDIIQRIIQQKVAEADSDTRGPPYDSLQTYAFEGQGSLTGSVSSLGLTAALPELNYAFLEDWEPERQTLERIVGEQLATDQSNPAS